jgi:hypothetical protein
MTGFRPSDWDNEPETTVKLEEPNGYGFQSLLEKSKNGEHLIEVSGVILICIAEPELLTTLSSFVFEYTFTDKIRNLGGPRGDKLVEYGVSRFKRPGGVGDREAETDEPLAILGLITFFGHHHQTLERHLREALSVANAPARGFAFEPFGAYLLARAFSSPTPLSRVFEFVGEHSLQDELAELVTLERIDDTFQTTPLKIDSDLRSSHVLGCSPSSVAETLEWLQNPRGSAFCFPANRVGPDLIFVLKLTRDGTVLRVCVQFKHTKELRSTKAEEAIRTTDPSNFLSQHKKGASEQSTTPDQLMRDNLVDAIKNLGEGTKKAGVCGVLRVVISYPTPLEGNALDNAAKVGGHPLATVAVDSLESPDSKLGQHILGLANQALGKLDRKRKSSEEIDRTRTKKPKKEDPKSGDR